MCVVHFFFYIQIFISYFTGRKNPLRAREQRFHIVLVVQVCMHFMRMFATPRRTRERPTSYYTDPFRFTFWITCNFVCPCVRLVFWCSVYGPQFLRHFDETWYTNEPLIGSDRTTFLPYNTFSLWKAGT